MNGSMERLRFSKTAGLPTAPAAFLAFGSALFISFVWYLLTWSLPTSLGYGDLASRLNPFALPLGVRETVPPLGDSLFWANLAASNALILGLPPAFVRLLHRGSAIALVLSFYSLILGMNLLFQAHHLSASYGSAHRAAYLCDLGAGLLAAWIGTRLGTEMRRRLVQQA
jgi:hypothetical protein